MTENLAPAATQDAPVSPAVQEPSHPQSEVKQESEAPQEGEGAKPEPSEAEKAKAAFDKRIARQTAANREQQRQLENERRLREVAEKRIADYEAKFKPNDDKPKLDDFNSPEDYAEAVADWKINQKETEAANKAKEPNVDEIVDQKLKVKEMETSFRAKEEQFRKDTPDYDKSTQVVNNLMKYVDPKHPSTQAFSTTLLNAPNPPQLIHYLGTHPDVAISLMSMSPFEITDQLGVIIDQLSDAPKAADPNGGMAEIPEALPAPPTPLKGATRPSVKPIEKMNGKELIARMEQLRKGK